MRFLVDNQLPGALATWLRAQGHDAEHVLDVQLAQAKDNPIWQYTESSSAVIVSKDEDFAEWVRHGRPGPAVVWLPPRQQHPAATARLDRSPLASGVTAIGGRRAVGRGAVKTATEHAC